MRSLSSTVFDRSHRNRIASGVLAEIADSLGVLPDGRVRLPLRVEGPTDVDFLSNVADVLRPTFPVIPDIERDPRSRSSC